MGARAKFAPLLAKILQNSMIGTDVLVCHSAVVKQHAGARGDLVAVHVEAFVDLVVPLHEVFY